MAGIAVGKPEELGTKLASIQPKSYVTKLMGNDFSGYLCYAVSGKTGIEEALVFFNKGKLRIANYAYFKYNTQFTKKEGQQRCMNAFAAKSGVLDRFSVTEDQAKLIMTLKEEEVFKDDMKIEIPKQFSHKFEDELIEKHVKEKKVSREDILRRFGITSLRSTEASKEELMIKAKGEDVDIQKLVKK
jgi:hypothetical protein